MTTVCAIIPAAGRGARYSTSGINKVFAKVCGRPILRWTATAFSSHPRIDGIIVVAGADEVEECRELLAGLDKIVAVVPGGVTRQESVARGLALVDDDAVVLVHDAARPLVTADIIDRCIDGVLARGSAVAAIPVADTLKAATAEGRIERTVDRTGLWAMQTPQSFVTRDLKAAYEYAEASGFAGTDEASLIEHHGAREVYLVDGSAQNFKVTRADDAGLAEAVLEARGGAAREAEARCGVKTVHEAEAQCGIETMRVGFGYDIHRFAEGRKLILGGVEFPSPDGVGLDGHSDADVLLHALCDALLGAAGLSDIGHLYPNTDSRYKGIASTLLLQDVRSRLADLNYRVSNVDVTVIAEKPKIGPKVEEIRAIIADHLSIDRDRVGIKATTNEGIGALGHGEGIAAHAVACIIRS